MKEYEIVAKFLNGCAGAAHPQTSFEEEKRISRLVRSDSCAGAAHPQTFFEEAELANTDDFVRTKHGKDFEKFIREENSHSQVVFTYDNGTVTYIYEFTEL